MNLKGIFAKWNISYSLKQVTKRILGRNVSQSCSSESFATVFKQQSIILLHSVSSSQVKSHSAVISATNRLLMPLISPVTRSFILVSIPHMSQLFFIMDRRQACMHTCMPVNTHTRISTHTQRYTCVRMQMKTKITDVVCLHYIVSFVPYKLQCKYLLLCVYWLLACMRVWDFVNVCDLGCVCTAHLLFTTLNFYCTCKGQFYLYCRFDGHLTLYYCCVLIFV